MNNAPQTLDELLECLDSIPEHLLIDIGRESFPAGVWMKQSAFMLRYMRREICNSYRPIQMGIPK